MKGKTLSDNFSELSDVIKEYVNARYDYLRIVLLEKLTQIGIYFISRLILFIVFLFTLLFLTFAFSYWYSSVYGSIIEAFLISAGFYFLLGILVYLFRKPLFAGNIVRNVSEILFPEKENEV